MRRVFLIISLLCLMPFTMMAQMRDAYNPAADELEALEEGKAYAFEVLDGPSAKFVSFNPEGATPLALKELKTYTGMKITAAEMVPYNSTKDFVYAYATADGIDGMFCMVDPVNGELTVITENVEPMSEMAYDKTTKTMYGLKYGVLYTIDLNTGEGTVVNEMQTGSNNWVALAINNEGLMYAITNTFSQTNAELYRISPSNNWVSTLVGTVPYRTQYAQSMAFDRDNADSPLYWWQNSAAGSNFVKVNPENASCTVIWVNNQYEMAGLMFKNRPDMFNITYETIQHGTVTGPVEAAENDVITVTPTFEPGFGMGTITWTANGEEHAITEAPYEFTMPDANVTVSANFIQTGVNTVFIDTDYYGYFDDIVTVAVEMTNENLVAGAQMDINLGANLTFQDGSLILGERAEGEGWNITGSMYGNVLRVTVFNAGLAYFTGNEGILFTFQVKCARVVSNNTLAISGLICGTPDSFNLNMLSTNGALEIKDVVMNQPANLVVCNNTLTEAVEFGSEIEASEGTITYAWTNDTPAIGLAAEGTGNIAAFTAVNAGTAPVVATVTVTPTLMHNDNPCVGTAKTFTITVNPTGVMNPVENIEVHNGDVIPAIEFTSALEGGEVTYAWTNDNTEIGLAANGTGNIESFTAVNEQVSVVSTANITVVPTFTNAEVSCEGAPINFTITVNPTKHYITVVDPLDGELATNPAEVGVWQEPVTVLPTPDPGFSMGTITWTANGEENTITGEAPYEFIMPDYDVTVSAEYVQTGVNTVFIGTDYYGYFDDIVTVAVEMTNENLVAGLQMNVDLGENLTFQEGTLALADRTEGDGWNITGSMDGNVLLVTVFNTGVLPFAGNDGVLFTFQVKCARVVSNNTLAISGLICGTPDGTNLNMLSTDGALEIKDVVMNQPENLVVCNNALTEAIEFSTEIEATEGEITYAWTNDNPAIGLDAEGTGNIAAFTAINAGTAPVVANLTVTPTLMHNGNPCVGSTLEFTITVNPTPAVEAIANQVVCNGAEVEAVTFATTATGGEVTYAWTNDTPAIGLEAEGTGNIAAFTAVNAGTAPVVATIAVTPTFDGMCAGEPLTFTITVNPTPVVEAVANQVVCNGAEVNAINFATTATGGEVTYAWVNDNPEIGLPAEGTGNIAAFMATNTTSAAVVANITVTPTFDGACVGEAVSFSITVLPQVVMDAVENLAICHNMQAEVNFTTTITDGTVTYAWSNDNPAIGLAAEGNGNISFTALNETSSEIVANVTVTPTYTMGENVCVGEAVTFTVTVYPSTTVDPVENQTVYSRESTEAIFFSAPVNDYEVKVIFNWFNDNPAIGLATTGTGNIPSFITAGSNVEQVAHITVTPVYNGTDHTCEGESFTFTITVLPTYLVVINEGIENGTLTDNARIAANGEHYAPAGEEITLIATPDADYFVDYVTVTDLNNSNIVVPFNTEYSFTMPEFDVLCNANFIDANNLSIQPGILDMGYRPINAWMYSKFFNVNNISESEFDITEIQFTDYTFMNPDPIALPINLEAGASAQIGINTNYKNVAPGLYSATMALKGEQIRKPYLRNMVANAYTPVEPDVWELATNVTTFPFVSTQETAGTLYNVYQLPGENADGYDGVYKVVIDHDAILSAAVTAGNDPKIAIYPQGFKGVGGPHTNNYLGASEPILNEATVGEGTLTSNYMPYNTYYNYSVSQMLFTAEELTDAGLLPSKINSIEFASNSTNGYTREHLSVYMQNTTMTETSTSSVAVTAANKVFEGSLTQVVGWNKFEFNGVEFVWDGTSNILVTVLMNEGAYTTSTPWLCNNAGFNAAAYSYRDSSPYSPETETITVTATTTRPNVKFNGIGGMTDGVAMGDEPIVNLDMKPGTYYIVASSTSEDSYTVEINVEDMPLPEPPTVVYPANGSDNIGTPVTFEYELGQYTREYQILLGTSYSAQDVVLDWTSDLSNTFYAGDLLHNKIYYWRINERNDSGVTEGPLWVFTTELNMPLSLTVVDDELFEGEDVAVFNWDTPADRTLRGYNLYKDGVKVNEAMIIGNTYTVEGLTYNMDGYDFNVTAVWDEGESAFSNTVNVKVSGFGTVNGYVYEQDGTTGIAGATVTIVGFDEFDDIQGFEFTTDANGYYSGNVYAGYFFGMAEKEGYQTAGDNIGFELEYQGTHANYNFILNEEYTPVTRVVAEEIDANQVHVYWGWDMIEDFESGTLTSYDWVNDTQYPWAITTTNPYEGTYCIKSTNEGVNSSTSAIEITMMVANDGMMSFYAKASSEANYDKGQFFIDGTAKTTMSGATNWTFKEYPVTAGMHTFKWAYTKDGSLSSNDDCFYVDFINFWYAAPPTPEGQTLVDFENGIPNNWTTIDADGDGHNWGLISEYFPSDGGHDSEDAAYSYSYNSGSIYSPDNYLVSPQIQLGGSIGFWANNHSIYYPEQVGVAVSTTGNTSASDFTTIWNATVDAKGSNPGAMPRENGEKIGDWVHYTVDLSAYSGMGYVAIRHYGTTNMWGLLIDDIAIEEPRERAFTNYNVYRKNLSTGATEQQLATGITEEEYDDNSWGSAAAGVYQWGVSANYAGNRGESEITWSNKIDKNMNTNVTLHVSTNSGDPVTGAVVTLTNTSEPGLNLVYNTTLEESGTYVWDSFRKGTYNVNITLDNFEPLTATATVWEPTTLSYVLTETIANIDELYVSTTGWAIFGEIPSSEPPAGAVTVKLTHGDNWGDGSGYQMLLDADATAFGNEIPTSGALTSSCSGTAGLYDAFEYKIPENADPNCSTSNMVVNNTVTITIPAGTYDWMITNPTPGDRIWIASAQGNVGGRQDDYVFEAGKTYEFTLSMQGSNDATNVTITDGNKNVYDNAFAPIPSTGSKDIADVVTVDNGYVVLPANNRAVDHYNVKLDGIMEGTTTLPFYQHDVTNLVEGETYTTAVQKVYTTGESEWIEFDWVYTACDNYAGLPSEPTAQWSGADVILNWTLPTGGDGPTPPPTGDGITFGFEEDLTAAGWTIQQLNSTTWTREGTVSFSSGDVNPHDGAWQMRLQWDYGDQDEWLITPAFAVPANASLNFWTYVHQGSTHGDHYYVKVSTDNGSTWTELWDAANQTEMDNYYVNPINIDLNSYAGQNVKIAWQGWAIDGLWYTWFVDDVTVSNGREVLSFNGKEWFRMPVTRNVTATAANFSKAGDAEPVRGNREVLFTDDFEDGALSNWINIDNDNEMDGGWTAATPASYNIGNAHSGTYCASSWSWNNVTYNPDHWLISPDVTGAGSIHYFVATNGGWPDHYGIFVSTTGTNVSDFTHVFDETVGTSKGVVAGGVKTSMTQPGNRDMTEWFEKTIELPAGTKYVAFRHYNSEDMNYLFIDDVTITTDGGGDTPVDPDDPTPAADVLGVQIFRDGEWIAQVEAPATTFTDLAVESASEYTFRVYYDGDTEDYMYYRMSCPQSCGIDEDPCKAPQNLAGEYVWNTYNDFGALITWTYGDFGTWLYYDVIVEGEAGHFVGENTDAVAFEWANMYPASNLVGGTVLTKVASIGFDANSNPGAGIYTLKVYFGGTTAPETLVYTQDYAFDPANSGEWFEITLDTPVAIDPTANLWIALYNDGTVGHLRYPAAYTATGTGGINGRWFNEDNTGWDDLNQYLSIGAWVIRGYVTNAEKGGETVAIPANSINANGQGSHNFSVTNAVTFPTFSDRSAKEPTSFNVYRNGSLIANVDYHAESGMYEYFDNVAIGNYQYQVTALYADCESAYAMVPDESVDYVDVTVTDVNDLSSLTKLYPNPTTGNVMIEASGMTHITVVSTLGQILYDANISGDMYELNLSQYNAGLYLVRIATENGVSVKRVTLVK